MEPGISCRNNELGESDNEENERLVSRVFSNVFQSKIEARLERFYLPGDDISKNKVLLYRVTDDGSNEGTSNSIPRNVVIKEYPFKSDGVSEKNISGQEFWREHTVTKLETHFDERKKIRTYPRLYNLDFPENKRILIKEFIPGSDLEKIAQEQSGQGGIRWKSTRGEPSISDILYPIALLHLRESEVSKALKREERSKKNLKLLKHGTPKEATGKDVAKERADRFSTYVQKVLNERGENLSKKQIKELRGYFEELDNRYVSKKELLSIVDGELDVFPHHGVVFSEGLENDARLIDGGGVEVGGWVRDLAVFGDPIFRSRWEPNEMVEEVLESYLMVREKLRGQLRYDEVSMPCEDDLKQGILFSAFSGCIRNAAAVLHYCGDDENYPVDEKTSRYIGNAMDYFESFREGLNGKYRGSADNLIEVMKKKEIYDKGASLELTPGKSSSEQRRKLAFG